MAEGIETEQQYQFLRTHGCEYGQGYFFSHPQPAEPITALLDKER